MSKPNFKPWRFAGQGILIDDDETEIVLGNVYSDDPIGWLISAAPDLYVALILLHEKMQCACTPLQRESGHLTDCWVPDVRDTVHAALAKAEGR